MGRTNAAVHIRRWKKKDEYAELQFISRCFESIMDRVEKDGIFTSKDQVVLSSGDIVVLDTGADGTKYLNVYDQCGELIGPIAISGDVPRLNYN